MSIARLGDERPEVTDVLAMHFCFVPAGPFVMGEGKEQYDHDLNYAFWIARFPVTVTNAQFQAFVAAGGYANKHWWREAQQAGRWKDGKVQTWYRDEWRTGPFDYGDPYNLPNHPVVGVTWYEALAFARWLDARYQSAGLIPAGQHVTLPNEPEWEKAARGGRSILAAPFILPARDLPCAPTTSASQLNPAPQRRYPWGADPGAERANASESQISTTSAVGAFAAGASPCGSEELAGNVWEWTRSLWGKDYGKASFVYPYNAQDGRENLAEGDRMLRVIRGGCYVNDAGGVGCGVRDWLVPYYESLSGGFRAVLSPSTSGR